MKTLDVGFLAICENDRLSGTVTDRDIVIRGIAGVVSIGDIAKVEERESGKTLKDISETA